MLEGLKMQWLAVILIIWFVWANSSKHEDVSENYPTSSVEAAEEVYAAPAEDLTEDQLDEMQQAEVDAVTSNCIGDCSGHKAGYEWAEENGISSESDCNGNSDSFNEGCTNFVNGGNGY